ERFVRGSRVGGTAMMLAVEESAVRAAGVARSGGQGANGGGGSLRRRIGPHVLCGALGSVLCAAGATGLRADIMAQGDVAPAIPANGKVNGDLSVGDDRIGAVGVNGGSTLSVTQDLFAGVGVTSQGDVTLRGAASKIEVGRDLVLGRTHVGGLTQS